MSSILRNIKLGTFASGLALGNDSLKKEIASGLLGMRGLPAKLVQIKSILNTDDYNYWKEAIGEIIPISRSEFEESIKLFSPDLFQRLTFDQSEKVYPASIGQVQKGLLDGNKEVAIKLRHANIKEQTLNDLGMIGFAGKLFSMLHDGFSLDDYQQMMTERLSMEMDFVKEAEYQNQFQEFFSKDPSIKIPVAFSNLTNERILCQEWVEALPAESFLLKCSEQEKLEFSDLISRFYFDSIFELGLVHSDPNPGNFGVLRLSSGIQLVVFDFGSVYQLSEKEKLALWGLIHNQTQPQWNDLSLLGILGFQMDTLKKIETKIHAYMSVIVEPFLAQTRYKLAAWNRKERCADILGSDKFQFMISAPAHFFSVMRAFQGLFYWCNQSSGDIWLYHKLSEKRIEMTRALQDFSATLPKIEQTMAVSLRIDVWRGNEKTVSLTLPRNAVEQLDQLIDPELKSKIIEQGFDIPAIQKQTRTGAYKPQELISWKDNEKEIRIYLE